MLTLDEMDLKTSMDCCVTSNTFIGSVTLPNHESSLAFKALAFVLGGKTKLGDVDMSTNGIVQYIVVRKDLLQQLGWPTGALIAQACHAVTAVTHLFHEDDHMKTYLSDMDNMHKVVLEASDENSLISLKDKLEQHEIKHKLWIEQPENIPTCLVAKPYPKEEIQKYFKKFKLFKV